MAARPTTALVLVVCYISLASPFAGAEAPDVVFQNDVRLRFEHVETNDAPSSAEALTLRLRPSLEVAATSKLVGVVELDITASVIPDDRNGLFTRDGRPAIPDPEDLDLNRLQVDYAPNDNLAFSLGRQRISLRDERFIGISDFRQNQQTYDAFTTRYAFGNGTTVEAGYIWQVNRFVGNRQPEGRLDSESFYLAASLPSPIGTLSAFHLDLELETDTLSLGPSQTTGVALDGRTFGDDVGLVWSGSFSIQDRDGGQPIHAALAAEMGWNEISFGLRAERLGSDNGVALQTPLGTLHKFNGAADVFTVTPEDGLDDIEVRTSWRVGSLGALRGTRFAVTYNDFSASEGDRTYGREWGASAASRIGPVKVSLAWAGYQADDFASDVDKVWITLSRRF